MSTYEPDFVERNGTWVLSMVGAVSSCMGVMFVYFLKSRCRVIKCCCAHIEREPIPLTPAQIEIVSSAAK